MKIIKTKFTKFNLVFYLAFIFKLGLKKRKVEVDNYLILG